MAMGCPHQGRSGGLNATITSRPFDSPRPSPGGYKAVDLAHTEIATPPEHTDAKLPQVDDADLSFVRRDPS